MIEDLGAEARALLDAARDGMSPDAAAVRRVRARIAAVGGAGAAAGGTAIGVKLTIVAVVAALAVGAGVVVHRATSAPVAAVAPVAALAPRPERASQSELPQHAAVAERAPAISDDDLITIETPPPVATPHGKPVAAGSPAPRPAVPGRASAAPRAASAGTPTPALPARAAISLAREVELLDRAMAALRGGDATGALHAVRQHAAETAGSGQLAEDAAAIEIEALCHLQDPTTRAKLAAFDARFPRSAQRSRLCTR